MDLAILRLIHIAAGAFWVGAVYTFFLFVQPTGVALGPDGQRFMYQLIHDRRMPLVILASAVTAVLAGILMLWNTSAGLRTDLLFDISRLGYTLGGIAGILTLGVGGLYVFPRTRVVERIVGDVLSAGRPPSDEERATLMRVGGESRRAGWLVLIGLAITVACMATARYWGALF
ncbi:MAG TPA: hypothetical protein VFM19_08745 [Candidatus Limnocylindria bacterium]|nr:hypothetical protein [Candidatus Limnocylindria bacterium]